MTTSPLIFIPGPPGVNQEISDGDPTSQFCRWDGMLKTRVEKKTIKHCPHDPVCPDSSIELVWVCPNCDSRDGTLPPLEKWE